MSSRTAFYPGSFDPPTLGHLDVLAGGLALADRVVVAIGVHAEKTALFSFDERRGLVESVARETFGSDAARVAVTAFRNLSVDAARECGATLMLRGVRGSADLDYEMQLAGMNLAMAPGIRTVFVPASPAVRPITATLVRQIASMGGDVAPFVPALVAQALRAKFAEQRNRERTS